MYYLSEYKTFNNKYEMNEAVSEHLSKNKYDLNNTDRDVLTMLTRYAVKYAGVAHLKVGTIADTVGKSDRTVRRAIAKLISLGIVEKVPFMRTVSGGYGANLYRILPFDDESGTSDRKDDKKPDDTGDQDDIIDDEPLHTLKQSTVINNTYLKPFYARFKSLMQSTAKASQSLVSRLYGVYKAHSTPLLRGQAFDKATVEQTAYRALNVAMQASKAKNIRNLAGYFNGVLDRMLDRLYYDILASL